MYESAEEPAHVGIIIKARVKGIPVAAKKEKFETEPALLFSPPPC